MLQEEEAIAQALANGNMGPGEELTPEEEEELRYPEDDGQQDTLEQVSSVLEKECSEWNTFLETDFSCFVCAMKREHELVNELWRPHKVGVHIQHRSYHGTVLLQYCWMSACIEVIEAVACKDADALLHLESACSQLACLSQHVLTMLMPCHSTMQKTLL